MNKFCKSPDGTKVQTLIFSKNNFNQKSAKDWAKKNDFKISKIDENENSLRIRQFNPSQFKNQTFRTIKLTEGVNAVIACPNKNMIKSKMADGGNVGEDKTYIAKEILSQLGGMGRLTAMTGARNFVALPNGVSFKLPNPRANYVKIMLNSMDLYDLEVGRIRANTYKIVDTQKGLYADMLKPAIEKATGLYLSLKEGGAVPVIPKTTFTPDEWENFRKEFNYSFSKEFGTIYPTDADMKDYYVSSFYPDQKIHRMPHYKGGKTWWISNYGGNRAEYPSLKDAKDELYTKYRIKIANEKGYSEGGDVDGVFDVTKAFGLSDIKSVDDVYKNIDKIAYQYASREMASIQVADYLADKSNPYVKEFMIKEKINSREKLKNYVNNRQSLLRAGKGTERREFLKSIKDESTKRHIDNIMNMAIEQSAEMDKKISEQENFAVGGNVKYVSEADKYKTTWGRKGIKEDSKAVGSFDIRSDGKIWDGYLYELDDFDKKYYSHIQLKDGERLYRYTSFGTDIGKYFPIVKVNIKKGLIYFLEDMYSDDDKNLVFVTRGIKPLYISLSETEKMADGGGIGGRIDFYDKDKTYIHKSGYEAKYIGNNTYEVSSAIGGSGFKVGDKFTPNNPEQYFTVKEINYTENIEASLQKMIDKNADEIAYLKERKHDLENNNIRPHKIIGKGIKPQYARKLAFEWLDEQIKKFESDLKYKKELLKSFKEGKNIILYNIKGKPVIKESFEEGYVTVQYINGNAEAFKKETLENIKLQEVNLPDTIGDKVYTDFFQTKDMQNFFGDELKSYWDKNKKNWKDEYVEQLRNAGFNDKDIFALLFGFRAVSDIKCDRDFILNGILGKRSDMHQKFIDSAIDAKKSGYYNLGLKSAISENYFIEKLFTKYKISDTPTIYDVDVTMGVGNEKAYIYKGDGIYIGKIVNLGESAPLDKYDAINKDYVGIVATSSEILYDAIKILFDDENTYIKDMTFLYNSLGGIDAKDVVSAFGVEPKTDVVISPLKQEVIQNVVEPVKLDIEKRKDVTADYKSAIQDVLTLEKYSRLTQKEGEYLFEAFKDYESLIDEYDDYVANVNFAYDGTNFEETEKADNELSEELEVLEHKGYLYFSSYDGTIEAYPITIDFVNAVRARLQTLMNISQGIDLFPETDVLIGGKADEMTLDDIAKKHNVTIDHILRQVKIGEKVESEHTNDHNKIIEIVKDHLYENADYYTKLQQIESSFDGSKDEGFWIDVPSESRNNFNLNALMEIKGMLVNSGVRQDSGAFRFYFKNQRDLDTAISILNKIQNPNYAKDMPKNLSQLKNFIKEGVVLRVAYNRNRPEWVGKMKTVVLTQTNGFYLIDGIYVPDNLQGKTWIEYPKSDMISFTPFGFTIYAKDIRNSSNQIKFLEYEYVVGEQLENAKNIKGDDKKYLTEASKMMEFVDTIYRLSESVEFRKGGMLSPDMFSNKLDYNLDKESVSCFIYSKGTGRMLILRRAEGDGVGTWSLISGGVDSGELYEESIKREIQEELGVNLNYDNLILLDVTKHPNHTHYYYELYVDKEFEPVLNGENDSYMWINMGELPENTYPLLKKYIKSNLIAS